MNRTKIEWTRYSWNPVTGCLHGCDYCYGPGLAKRFKKAFPHGFKPHFYPERLHEPGDVGIEKPSLIFTVSMGDLFGEWVPELWQRAICGSMMYHRWHYYQMLTKAPWNISKYYISWPENVAFGTTIEHQEACDQRLPALKSLDHNGLKFVSFEPLYGMIDCDLTGIDWIIIGAQTNPKRYPGLAAIESILMRANKLDIPVFFKRNIKDQPGLSERMYRQEYPTVWKTYDKNTDHQRRRR